MPLNHCFPQRPPLPHQLPPSMENNFLANALNSQALMFLAANENARRNLAMNSSNPPMLHNPLDKDNALNYAAAASSLYNQHLRRGSEGLNPFYGQMGLPFIHPGLDPRLGALFGANHAAAVAAASSAFRPLMQSDKSPLQSSPVPSKRIRLHNEVHPPTSSEVISPGSSRGEQSRTPKREPSISPIEPRKSPLFKDRSPVLRVAYSPSSRICCPICTGELEQSDLENHLAKELNRLISELRELTSNDFSKSEGATLNTAASSQHSCSPFTKNSTLLVTRTSHTRYETFLRVKANRQNRLSASKFRFKRPTIVPDITKISPTANQETSPHSSDSSSCSFESNNLFSATCTQQQSAEKTLLKSESAFNHRSVLVDNGNKESLKECPVKESEVISTKENTISEVKHHTIEGLLKPTPTCNHHGNELQV